MIRIKILVISLIIASTSYAQDGLSLSIYQDARLMILGDEDHNIEQGTLNLVLRLKMEGKQDKFGYFIVYPEFEIANIQGTYKRYSANVGYVLNKLIIDDLELGFGLGWGWIDRWGKTMFSYAATSNISYKITDNIKLSLLAQITERKDLAYRWGNSGLNFKNNGILRFSGMIGIEYKF